MSNLERQPAETATGGLATVSLQPIHQTLAPREVPLGGVRALMVRRTLPHREIRTVGAWCFLDDYGPTDAGQSPMVVPPHPHTGLQTVTWLLSGEVLHQDSLGSEQLVRPGELNLMTAGRGIAHAETSTPASPDLRGMQLWVALPDEHREMAPAFEHLPDLPVLPDGDLTATVLLGRLGRLGNVRSHATAFTPIVGADVWVRSGGSGSLPLEPSWEHAVLALTDGALVDGTPLPAGSLVYLGCGRDRLDVAASSGADARVLLVGGEPFAEQLLMWWNFVGRSHDEVAAAREEWMAAVAGESTRFGAVSGYDGPALPAPVLPGTRLRPRGNR